MRATGAAVQLSYSVPLLAVPAVSESTPVTESDVMLCYVMLSLLPCERRTRVHTAVDSVGGAMTAIASLPAPGDVDGTLLELEYRKRLEMFRRRQDARSVASCVQLGMLPLASAHLSVMTPAALSSFSSQCP